MDDTDCERRADDAGLLAGLAASDDAAFTAIFDQHSAAVYRYAWGLVDDRSDVHDVVQETFLVLWRRRKSIEVVGGSVLPWLLVTCRQTTWNLNRRVRANATVPLADHDPADGRAHAEEKEAATDELRWVMEEIRQLSNIDQRLCELCLIDGRPYDEAAARLGITPSTARKRVQRARLRLRAVRESIGN